MSLINKNIFFMLGMTFFFTMPGCATTSPSTSPTNPTMPMTPQGECPAEIKMAPQAPPINCAVADPKLHGYYNGDCQNGKAQGQGKAIGKNVYQGQFVNGLPHGQGVYMWGDGKCFTGQFKQGEPQIAHLGCEVADPRLRGTYSGACQGGKAHGRGKAVGIDTYQGEFFNGLLNGQGTYVWPNGDRYIGQFKQGQADGRGVMRYADGEEERGVWQNGEKIE
jgi:hypothetical protein